MKNTYVNTHANTNTHADVRALPRIRKHQTREFTY